LYFVTLVDMIIHELNSVLCSIFRADL